MKMSKKTKKILLGVGIGVGVIVIVRAAGSASSEPVLPASSTAVLQTNLLSGFGGLGSLGGK